MGAAEKEKKRKASADMEREIQGEKDLKGASVCGTNLGAVEVFCCSLHKGRKEKRLVDIRQQAILYTLEE